MKKLNTLLVLSVALISGSAFAANLNDGQIIQIIKTANQAEINEAQVIVVNGSNQSVKDFAAMMIADHTKSDAAELIVETKAGIKAGDSDENKNLQNITTAKLTDLKKVVRGNLDLAYMDDQVIMHQTLLNDLDQTLIPQAQNADVKDFLQDTRTTVASHLTQAQQIQSTLTTGK